MDQRQNFSLDDLLGMLRKKYFPNQKGLLWVLLLIVIGASTLFTSVYTIGVDEVGVIQRFGQFKRVETPGLNFKLPSFIEKLTKVKIKKIYTEEFGFRTSSSRGGSQFSSERQYLDESLMLTGDLNCAVVPWIVQYRIDDPYLFLFKVHEVVKTLRDLSEACVRQVVGDHNINEVINKRREIADEAKVLLQKSLLDAHTGITAVNVELKKTNVPGPVESSFNEVNQATQEKERLIYEAKENYNKAIPSAKGEAQKALLTADGYATERVNRAKGNVAGFVAVWEEYRKAPEITRRRLYLESMRKVVDNVGKKYIIDPEQKGLLPLLNLQPGGTK